MPEANDSPEITMAGGQVSSSQIPGFHLIPTEALVRLAMRFDAGVERKREKAWNAITPNQEVLTNREFILHRIGHIVGHSSRLRDKIIMGNPMDGDDDAGALIWGGAFLCCATRALENARRKPNCSACGGTGKFLNSDRECPACRGKHA